MKTQHPKLKTSPRPLFSCAFFCRCNQTTLSPTNTHPPTLPLSPSEPPQPQPQPPIPRLAPPPAKNPSQPESSSSSSSTSQSFTQWRFPLPNSPLPQKQYPQISDPPARTTVQAEPPPQVSFSDLRELFHIAEIQLTTESDSDQLAALHSLERSLVPNPPLDPNCPPELMRGVVRNLRNKLGAKSAAKVLLALCLAESSRRVAVEVGAVGAVVEVVSELEDAAAERALAALELMCTLAEGATELRTHALAVPVMVTMMGRMAGRGREYAISVLSVVYASGFGELAAVNAPPEEVARAVELALQRDCSARGRRKGAQLLKTLREDGRLDLTKEGE